MIETLPPVTLIKSRKIMLDIDNPRYGHLELTSNSKTSEEALQKEHDKELFKIKKNIKETPSWLSKVEKDAKSKNISLEECLRQHAEFMLMKGKKEKWKQSH